MVHASERLRELDVQREHLASDETLAILAALPLIADVVEAAEKVDHYFASIGWTSDDLRRLGPALTALCESLEKP